MRKWISSLIRRVFGGKDPATGPVVIPPALPVLPLRNSVMFPWGVLPLSVGRPSSIALVEDAIRAGDSLFVLAAQKDMGNEDPRPIDLYPVATVARITRLEKSGDGASSLQVQGLARCRLTWFVQQTPYLTAKLEVLPEAHDASEDVTKAMEELRGLARQLVQRPGHPPESDALITSIADPGHLADLLAANLPLRVREKQRALETLDLSERLALVKGFVRRELEGTTVDTTLHKIDIPIPAIPPALPVLPSRDSVLFPGGELPILAGRPSSLALVKDADAAGGLFVIAAQKDMGVEDPRPVDLYPVATVARITRLVEPDDGTAQLQVQGLARCRLTWFIQQTPYLAAKLEVLPTTHGASEDVSKAAEELRSLARQLFQGPGYPPEAAALISSIPRPEHLTDLIAANLPIPVEERQRLLETLELSERMALVSGFMKKQLRAPGPGLRVVPKEE